MDQPVRGCAMHVRLSPKIISGTGIPRRADMASMGPALRIGCLRVVMVKVPWGKVVGGGRGGSWREDGRWEVVGMVVVWNAVVGGGGRGVVIVGGGDVRRLVVWFVE